MTTLAVAIVALLLVPALASAQNFEVDTIADFAQAEGCVNSSIECSLREAILRANENPDPDEITFGEITGPATIELVEVPLPPITQPVAIEGSTAAGYLGAPVIEIDGINASTDGDTAGFEVSGAGVAARIEDLAIVNFDVGVRLGLSDGSRVCGNRIGVELSGAVAPNGTGVLVGGNASDANVGGESCGNLISGNTGAGIVDEGLNTEIGSNLIGTDAGGDAARPNGGAGIEVTTVAGSTSIGPAGEANVANTIAFNGGPGVLVEDADTVAVVYGNSIFDNGGLGIQILAGDAVSPPTIESVQYSPETVVTGTLTGEPNTTYYVDFYANEACDPSGSGEGRTYLNDWQVSTDSSGVGHFTASEEEGPEGEEGLRPIPAGQEVITATATTQISEVGENTSEFSQCFAKPGPPASPPPPPAAIPFVAEAPVPENGETLAVAPQSGVIYIKLPGQDKQTKLEAGQLIPVGSIVDATHGKVILTSVNKAGEAQTAIFFGGRFLVAQRDGSGLVTLKLKGGNFSACKGGARKSGASASGRSGRRLWGSGKGKFRTEGSYGSATVRGTIWLTEDRCGGTFFKVRRGVVTVRDFGGGESFPLAAGKSYLAMP